MKLLSGILPGQVHEHQSTTRMESAPRSHIVRLPINGQPKVVSCSVFHQLVPSYERHSSA